MDAMTECPPFHEKEYRVKRKLDEDGNPIKHSRWVRSSPVPRHTKAQDKWFGDNFTEPQGWRKGARISK
jgi:hypothetical protein